MDQLTRNPDQPRRYFDSALLDELAASIKDKGVLQPILVRPLPKSVKGKIGRSKKPAYQIIAGERRWQAAIQAGLTTIPVFVREITDREALEIGVVENVHRADLNPMEEALAYKSLLTQFKRTQEDVAGAVGKSRPYIANMLRLLTLPSAVQSYLAEGKISTGHARAIIAAPDPEALANAIVDKDLSVRDAESWVRRLKQSDNAPALEKAIKEQKSADIRHVEKQIEDVLGLKVDLRHKGRGGELRLKYKSNDQLEGLIAKLVKG
ncbi:MAG: ParB/RepB/Spo0J family partition protein [Hellea sp.]|nr:ParB/RepB/Spo0J family partition protein [Hellea sp.]